MPQQVCVVLSSAEREQSQSIGVSRPTVWRWQQRFAESGVEGLLRDKTRKPGKAPLAADTTARVVALTCTAPPHQATHWTGRAMARVIGISVGSVQRIWRAHRLQPHRLRTFKRSRDPSFVLEGESPVRLGGRARDLLIALLEQAGQLITKEALSARLWPNIAVEEGTLRVHVAALRKALRDGQEGRRYIANIAGRGYAFVGEVVATDEPDPAADAPPEARPLLSTARLFGRAEVIATLSTRLARHRLITITGPGGIGKTSVALAVADSVRPRLPDGVCIVDFALLADNKLVPTALASALGIGMLSENPLPSLVALLRNRDMLIVLDNCEHVIDAAAALLVESLIQGGARLRILATSREPIRVPGEMLFRLAPLATTANILRGGSASPS